MSQILENETGNCFGVVAINRETGACDIVLNKYAVKFLATGGAHTLRLHQIDDDSNLVRSVVCGLGPWTINRLRQAER